MHKIRKGDNVVVITGRDKGKSGAVLRVLASGKVVVEGVNRVKKHQRPNPMKGQTGGIIDREMPIDVSNVMLVNPATGKGDRVGFRFLEAQGGNAPRKVRFFKSNGEVVDA
jgi:large subunit ribosomal protein L24